MDSAKQVSFYFLEAQKVVNDLAITHSYNSKLFGYNRDILLSLLPLNVFLKSSETMGIFIDSEQPYFRFKLELSETGTFRTMMFPEAFEETPDKLIGKCRITKILPSSKKPYHSIVEMKQQSVEEVINHVLEQSYQTKSKIILSTDSDQAVLINVLPDQEYDKLESVCRIEEVYSNYLPKLQNIMSMGLQEEATIIEQFKHIGLNYLGAKEIKFFCPCSMQGMISNVETLPPEQLKEIFAEDGLIAITCDYCKKSYEILEEDMKRESD